VPASATAGKPESKVAQTGKSTGGKNTIIRSGAGGKRSVDEQLLMELRLNAMILAEAIPAFINGSSLMLPIGELSTALEFPITVDSAASRAGGWFLSENRLFSLDTFTSEVIIEGVRSKFDPSMAITFESDIFVDIRLLSVWFPIDITYDISNLAVFLKSRESLPIERRIRRALVRQRALGAQESGGRVRLPKKTFDRPLIAPPMVDLNLESSLNRGNGISTVSKRYSLLASGDYLKTNSQLFVSGSDTDTIDTIRLRADRKDPDGYVFGDLGITEFSIGDITTPQLGLVSSSPLGRGVTVSTLPLNQPREFDRTTLTGELPLGWDVELYRNEILIDFKAARDDGRYEFADVPLLFGVNILKLVFYGPQGQTREEIQQFRVGPDQLKPGQLDFLLSANQHNQTLIDRNPNSADERRGQERLLAEVQTGVNKNLSLAASATSIPLASGERANYGSLSGRFSVAGLFGRVDYVDQIQGGWATKWSAQRQIIGISVIGEHSIFSNFESEQVTDSDDPLRTSSKLRLDGRIAVPLINQIPVNLTFNHDKRKSGDVESSMESRFSGGLGRASVTHSSTHTRTVTAGDTVITSEGNLLIGGRIGDLKLRTSAGYQMRPIKEFTTVSLTGDWDIARNLAATVGARSPHRRSNEHGNA